ncbi:MAG: hypothetical protein Cons2KO_13040 [Congregibacter sp.]
MGIVATSVISVGGVSFSITMVALSLTSGQYGPKVLRQFLSSVSSKVSLGLFFSTALFAVAIFIGMGSAEVPRLSVLTAIALAGLSLLEFMRFVHRTTSDLQADKIIQRLGEELRNHLLKLVDEERGDAPRRSRGSRQWRALSRGVQRHTAASKKSGYVQTIDYHGALECLRLADATAILAVHPGNFVVAGQQLFTVWVDAGSDISNLQGQLLRSVTTGEIRTSVEDPQFPITQIQQIAARALSPGVNDPGTAISCIDSITQAFAVVMSAEFPGATLLDEEDSPRLLTLSTGFTHLVDFTFSPLRLMTGTNLTVANCLLDSLLQLIRLTDVADRREPLLRQGELLMDSVRRHGFSDFDLRELECRFRRLR